MATNEVNPSGQPLQAVPQQPYPPAPPHPGQQMPAYGAAPGYAPAQGYAQAQPMSDVARMMQYDAGKKTALIAYLLWWFLGWLGAHRFYLGQTGIAVGQLVLFFVSLILTFVFVGLLGFVALGIWLIVDAFLIPGVIQRHNQELAQKLSIAMPPS